jgi:hypothetical protein
LLPRVRKTPPSTVEEVGGVGFGADRDAIAAPDPAVAIGTDGEWRAVLQVIET